MCRNLVFSILLFLVISTSAFAQQSISHLLKPANLTVGFATTASVSNYIPFYQGELLAPNVKKSLKLSSAAGIYPYETGVSGNITFSYETKYVNAFASLPFAPAIQEAYNNSKLREVGKFYRGDLTAGASLSVPPIIKIFYTYDFGGSSHQSLGNGYSGEIVGIEFSSHLGRQLRCFISMVKDQTFNSDRQPLNRDVIYSIGLIKPSSTKDFTLISLRQIRNLPTTDQERAEYDLQFVLGHSMMDRRIGLSGATQYLTVMGLNQPGTAFVLTVELLISLF